MSRSITSHIRSYMRFTKPKTSLNCGNKLCTFACTTYYINECSVVQNGNRYILEGSFMLHVMGRTYSSWNAWKWESNIWYTLAVLSNLLANIWKARTVHIKQECFRIQDLYFVTGTYIICKIHYLLVCTVYTGV